MDELDAAIVGAGAVGLAVAARLAGDGRTVAVFETHPRYGVETSSRNSEVVHAGIYYPAGSLKSRLCSAGRVRLYELGRTAGVFVKKTGKLIVACDDEEAGRLREIKARGDAAGAEGLELIDGPDAERRVPGLKAAAAIWSPESGIMDSEDLMRHYYARAADGGVFFQFKTRVNALERVPGGWIVSFGPGGERVKARWVVNSAGLHADRVAAMAGVDIDSAGYRLHWCKGVYFRVHKETFFPHLVYPVPAKHGLGVHLTMDRTGGLRLGPDTKFVDSIDYEVDPGLAESFRASVARYWPGVESCRLTPDTAGIRPKLSGPKGGFRDFVVADETDRGFPGLINLIGIESPGLTASPAIADMVAGFMA